MRKIGIIGGGAAGFFAAITAKETDPEAEVFILEKSTKLLSKVKISGGGRCNVTNATFENHLLVQNYPRGGKELKKAFTHFSSKHTVDWFQSKGVALKTEADKRIFPVSDDSQTIVDCLLKNCEKNGVKVHTGITVTKITKYSEGKFELSTEKESFTCDKVLIATGGSPKREAYQWIEKLGHSIEKPIPSLFTFNIPDSKYEGLQGISVANASIRITGSKALQQGPVLITHWGLSGPAVLRLSAWEAKQLHELDYNFTIHLNWTADETEDSVRSLLQKHKTDSPKKTVSSNPLFNLPKRLWERITMIAEIPYELKWGDVPNKNINKLIEELYRSNLMVKGKTTFKEEFVTCGGVVLKEINFETMESLVVPGLHFAGEVLNIDAITGGFNFQAAWTTGYIAGRSMALF